MTLPAHPASPLPDSLKLSLQDLPAWRLLGIYTGQVLFSGDAEKTFRTVERGVGYLLMDKRKAPWPS